MAAHSARPGDEDSATLPDAVPFELPILTRLSWELGARVVADDEATVHSRWECTNRPWTLSLFHVTDHTDLVRVRTPVGRERFYGATRSELDDALGALVDAPDWERVDDTVRY